MPAAKLDFYEVLETIGSGSYGTCKKVRRRADNKILVWKELDYGTMSECEKQMLVSEVNLLRELRHPNIVRYYDRIIDRSNTTIYLVMEYCEGGDLSKLISRHKQERKYLGIDFIWKLFAQLVSAVQECHKRENGQQILHRDLKPANVFLDAHQNVKLGDFGLARVLSHDMSLAKTFVGTPYYMSPEQMNKTGYNDKSDVWSLGCLLYEACSLTPPFLVANQKCLAEKIMTGRFRPIPSHFPSSLNHLISTMLRVNDDLRPSITDLAENPVLSKRNIEVQDLHRLSDLKQREESLKQKEKALNDREKELNRRERILKEQEKTLEQKLSRTEMLLNELQLERKENNLDLLKNKYFGGKNCQFYNKENEHTSNEKYWTTGKAYSTQLNGDLNKNLTRAWSKVGLRKNMPGMDTHIHAARMQNMDVPMTRRLAYLR